MLGSFFLLLVPEFPFVSAFSSWSRRGSGGLFCLLLPEVLRFGTQAAVLKIKFWKCLFFVSLNSFFCPALITFWPFHGFYTRVFEITSQASEALFIFFSAPFLSFLYSKISIDQSSRRTTNSSATFSLVLNPFSDFLCV